MVGLYFGSFNPVHIGHMAIANYFVEYANLTELWFVVTPHNPLKNRKTLLSDYQRLELLHLALRDYPKFKVSDIEFSLPKPSYTIDTLTYLDEKYPNKDFALIMGEDNLSSFNRWKNYEQILNNRKILVYPRPGSKISPFHNHKNVEMINAPNIEISSSFIRGAIKQKRDVRFFLPERVWDYIKSANIYTS
jgi:nicotinate-nucleotide adenylyltransferase